MKNLKEKIYNHLVLVGLFLLLPAVWALIPKGFYGASDDVHIAWLYEMFTTLKLGQFPPRFVPDLSFGYGYPLFNFVFPLPYYIGSFFHLIGFTLVESVKLVFFVSIPLSYLSMYKLLRKFCLPLLSVIGALAYVYTPYRSTDIYVRGAIGEILGFVFLPLIILAFTYLTDQETHTDKRKWVGVGAISVGFLILSHNIVSYMFIPAALLYAALRIFSNKHRLKVSLPFGFTILLGLLLSSYFWIPALIESNLLKYDTVFNFWDHFPTVGQLITPYFGYGASVPGNYDGMSFFVGSANLFLVIITAIVFVFKFKTIQSKDKTILLWAVITFTGACFMMNYRSTYLWKTIPFLPYFQFPWRFLTLTTLVTPLMIVSLKYVKSKVIPLILVLLVITTFSYFRPQDFLGKQDAYFLAKYIPYPEVKSDYYTQQEEYLRLPKIAESRPISLSTGLYQWESGNSIQLLNTTYSRLSATADITIPGSTIVSYGKYYFPGWIATDNGKKIDTFSSPPYGQVAFNLKGGGEHNVKVYFQETSFRLIWDILSLTVFSISLLLIFWKRKSLLK
jgi:hypothetical protein